MPSPQCSPWSACQFPIIRQKRFLLFHFATTNACGVPSSRLKLEALSDKDPGRLDDDTDTEDQPSDAPLAKESIDPASSGAGAEAEATPTPSCSQEAGADMPMSQPQPTNSETLLDEEDLNIEEYDSD